MTRNSPDSDKKPNKSFNESGALTIVTDRTHSARLLPMRDLE